MDRLTDSCLRDLVPEVAHSHDVPGLAVGVLSDGRQECLTTGVTSTADPLPVTDRTLFLIGSTTKTLTATALLTQVEAGRLSLDDRVVRHLPGLQLADPDVLDVLTVRMLLNHTGGWRGDGVLAGGWGEDALAWAVAEVLPGEPQLRAPGSLVSYNNSGFALAGRLLEVVTGQEFGAAVRDCVLTPLGMDSTFFLPWEVAGRRCAVGHAPGNTPEPVPGWPLTRASGPTGGAVSSLRDLLAWAAYCLDGTAPGQPPLSEETRLLMQQPTVSCRSTITGVGLSWLLQRRGEIDLVTHGGNVSNLQLGTFVLSPHQGAAVVALSNSRGGADAGRDVVDTVVGVPEDQLDARTAAHDLVGRYDAGAWELHVTADGDRRFVQMVVPPELPELVQRLFARPPTEVVGVGTDQLAAVGRPWEVAGDIGRDAGGAVAWLRWGMRIAPRLPEPEQVQ